MKSLNTELKITDEIQNSINAILRIAVSDERKKVLEPLVSYIKNKIELQDKIYLNFICTHNSRRSQFSQIWADTASIFYNIPIESFSGGVEITELNEQVLISLKNCGFFIEREKIYNSGHEIFMFSTLQSLRMFSKLYNDPINPKDKFAAIMTCSHADKNCPIISGAEIRIPIMYDDPKLFDNTPEKASKYHECCLQIASEMFYLFSQVKILINE